MTTVKEVFDEILVERAHQDTKWGGPAHDDQHTMRDFAVLIEERTRFVGIDGARDTIHLRDRRMLIEIAAVAVAAVQSRDRKYAGVKVPTRRDRFRFRSPLPTRRDRFRFRSPQPTRRDRFRFRSPQPTPKRPGRRTLGFGGRD